MLIRLLFLGFALSLASQPASAASRYRVRPIEIGGAITYQLHPCPCARLEARIKLVNGEWENRTFYVSLESLYELRRTETPFLNTVTAQLHTIGAVDATWKTGVGTTGVGLSFSGLQWGEQVDQGYSDMLTTGVHALLQLYRSQALGLSLRGGYEYSHYRVNEGPMLRDHEWMNALDFSWSTGRWSGKVDLRAYSAGWNGLDTWDGARWQGSLKTRVATHRYGGAEMGVGAEFLYETDPARNAWGLDPEKIAAFVNLDILWETAR